MIIALDANAWISERLLRSSVGTALLYAARRIGAHIVLPEVTRKEVIHKILETGRDAVSKVSRDFLIIQAIVGSRPDYRLPSDAEFERAIAARFQELGERVVFYFCCFR